MEFGESPRRVGGLLEPTGRVDELYEFSSPIGKMVFPKETIRFIEWLQPLARPEHAYYAVLLTRTKQLRMQGFGGRDKALAKAMVSGYLRNPKLMLYLELRRLSLLAAHSDQLFVYEKHDPGTRKVVEAWKYPPAAASVLVSVNVHDWVRASLAAVKEFVDGVWRYGRTGESSSLVRLDDRVKSVLPTVVGEGTKRFFTIDVDDRSAAEEVLNAVEEYLGFTPARITTPRGMHIVVSWSDVPRRKVKEFAKVFLPALQEMYGGLIEWKKLPLEPLPGTEYKDEGFVVRFYPDER